MTEDSSQLEGLVERIHNSAFEEAIQTSYPCPEIDLINRVVARIALAAKEAGVNLFDCFATDALAQPTIDFFIKNVVCSYEIRDRTLGLRGELTKERVDRLKDEYNAGLGSKKEFLLANLRTAVSMEGLIEKIYLKASEIAGAHDLEKSYWEAKGLLKERLKTLNLHDGAESYPASRICGSALEYLSKNKGKGYKDWLESERVLILANIERALKQ